MKETKLKIFEIVGSSTAVSTDAGQQIFNLLDKAFQNNITAILDFQEIKLMTSAFLNAAIGQLYSKYDSEKLQALIKLENISNQDKLLIKKVVDSAKEYFSNKEKMDKIIDQSLNNV